LTAKVKPDIVAIFLLKVILTKNALNMEKKGLSEAKIDKTVRSKKGKAWCKSAKEQGTDTL